MVMMMMEVVAFWVVWVFVDMGADDVFVAREVQLGCENRGVE